MEIILLIIGIGAFVVSFVLPAAKEEQPVVNRELTKEEIIENVREGYITHWEMLIRNYNKYIDCVESLLKSEKNN